jgi:hypothetical protein
MDKQYLLTYLDKKKSEYEFEWFETEQELLGRIEELGDSIMIHDAIKVATVENFV